MNEERDSKFVNNAMTRAVQPTLHKNQKSLKYSISLDQPLKEQRENSDFIYTGTSKPLSAHNQSQARRQFQFFMGNN